MCAHTRFKSFLLLFSLMFCLGTSKSFAAEVAAAEEWIDVEVVVNVLDGANASNIDDAIAKANDALKKAKIRLVKKATEPNTADSDGSGGLDRAERDKTREEGQKVLDKTVGAGKGVKIDVSDANCDADDANAVGISIHRNPVIIVEPDADANELGKTIAHELGHVFTLDYDKYGPNDVNSLMYGYTGSGTDLNNAEVNEIRQGARVRGTPYFIVPRILSGNAVAVPAGMDYSINWFGAILDNFHDVLVNDPYNTITDPNDPTIQYADMGEIICDGLLVMGTHIDYYIETTIQLGNLPGSTWNVDSFFDITYQIEFGPPIGRAHIVLQNWTPVSAIWYDANNLPTPAIIDVQVETESEFLGMPHYAVPHNKTVQVKTPLDDIILAPDMPKEIIAQVSSQHLDYRYAPDPVIAQLMDQTLPFKVRLSHPCPGPSLSFAIDTSSSAFDPNGVVNIFGCCFDPNVSSGHIAISTDQRLVYPDHYVTVTDSKLSASVGCSTLKPNQGENWPQWYRVDFKPQYEGPPENAPRGATGYFKYYPGGEIPGDLNSDGAVNLYDFAILARHWLEGATPQ